MHVIHMLSDLLYDRRVRHGLSVMSPYGEFVAFFGQLCEVSDNPVIGRSVLVLNYVGGTIFA